MTRLVCINNNNDLIDGEDEFSIIDSGSQLIIDKVYDVLDSDTMDFNNPSEIYYLIENELGQKFWYSSNRFKSISDHRDDKLVILFGEQKTLTK